MKYEELENERLEREEQSIGEPEVAISPEEMAQLDLEKRMEEADSRENDINNGWEPEL